VETVELLRRWHEGDREALAAIVERELPWLRAHVHRRLGPQLRRRGETEDYVQEALIDALRYGPRFVVADEARLRALLGRIVENTLRDQVERHEAQKRDVGREEPLPSGSVLDLDTGRVTRPSEAAAAREAEAWVRLALELLDPEDRRAILMREWEGRSFPEIGAALGVGENAARMRFQRALPRLAGKVRELRKGAGPFSAAEKGPAPFF